MGGLAEVTEVKFKHLFYSNYGSGATDILHGDILECIDLYYNLLEEVEIDKTWQVYLTQLPRMDKDSYVSFEDYKSGIFNPNSNQNSEAIVSDNRTDDELESYADSIMFGNSSLELREKKIKVGDKI
ncbi:hypothetical protein [Psychrobacillus sp. BM2]|uniref:hypothetical protein n=1 Tax=Psychrobacillus sp. BM2 TaxID=3400421 RepID=UPI003B021EF6